MPGSGCWSIFSPSGSAAFRGSRNRVNRRVLGRSRHRQRSRHLRFRDPADLLVADMTPTLRRAMKVAFTKPSTNGSARSMCSRISRSASSRAKWSSSAGRAVRARAP
ncbi:MAG: hypothetical protein EOS26_09245 [Mesorhizobium sp.]|nr:MAG: hypothetical protein EOS26_09245 [Mesorhizobium sp.]